MWEIKVFLNEDLRSTGVGESHLTNYPVNYRYGTIKGLSISIGRRCSDEPNTICKITEIICYDELSKSWLGKNLW